jgi:hypothetical protein
VGWRVRLTQIPERRSEVRFMVIERFRDAAAEAVYRVQNQKR